MPYGDLVGGEGGESSAVVRARVEAARARQRERFRDRPGIYANAHMTARDVRRHCQTTREIDGLLNAAVSRLGFSARVYHRVLKIARTIADLAGVEQLGIEHVTEAIQYRTLDRSRHFT